jgi:hypothetical protein
MDEDYVTGNLKDLAKQGIEAISNALTGYAKEEFEKWVDEDDLDGGPTKGDELYDILTEVLDECDGRHELPESLCPICQMEYIKYDDVLRYLLNRMGRTYKELCAEIKHEFDGDPSKFYAGIKDTSINVS